MRLIRYQTSDHEKHIGWMLDDKVGPIRGDVFDGYQREEATIPLELVRLLSPVQPSKIIAVARNYAAHAAENNAEVPEIPVLFFKPPSAVIGPGEAIRIPPQTQQMEHEAGLAVVIGKEGRWIDLDKVNEHILGYTIANDVTARDLQHSDLLWTRAKGFDTFAPLGPWIETNFDPTDAMITCYVNGVMRQMASTRDMVFTVKKIIAFISSVMTLCPGDVILTGTPEGVGPLEDGDEVAIKIEGIGTLTNAVKALE
ncbi:MAG: 2-hydroxyhepta-2,4-diene-1,7-dioate isomerase [Chloroflexota bacterium]|nr:MAG: 2-hydroxyhepta-2,4-diene-1,7-dioate isomerase [Chloroflexota bacterium]